MTCPPCTHDCDQGKTCPAKNKQAIANLESQEPVAWQWLGSAHFRKKIPKNADITAWNPLYHYPQKLEQKIVAWGVFEGNLHDMFFSQEEAQEMARLKGSHAEAKPLYTYPPQRTWVGLTDEEISDCLDMSIQKTCRAIEAKLKQKNT
jgi:hypothetical protein